MLYGNRSNGYGYSPDRSRDVDRFNPSTASNYSASFASACGSRQTGYYHSASDLCGSKPKVTGRYLGNGQYIED